MAARFEPSNLGSWLDSSTLMQLPLANIEDIMIVIYVNDCAAPDDIQSNSDITQESIHSPRHTGTF